MMIVLLIVLGVVMMIVLVITLGVIVVIPIVIVIVMSLGACGQGRKRGQTD